ncbi:MAG TPA: TIR domain-containing protein, partial [Thermoanaerobaculia bacterium]|nr:TIR domain-containing protein [Thermoanaerobaculia bacterium]
LLTELTAADFALMVGTPDDVTRSRRQTTPTARDNVTFELGAAMGRLGHHRVFLVHPDKPQLKFPSDLAGFVRLPYDARAPLARALAPVIAALRTQIAQLGFRRADALVADARLIRDPEENYDRAIELLERAFRERLLVFEVSDSENHPRYERKWRELMRTVRGDDAPDVYRLFDRGVAARASGAVLQSWARLATGRNQKWFHARVVTWPVDLLVLATRAHEPIEALIGMSSCAFDRWMAVNTRNEAWVNILREYAWQAATTGPLGSIQDLLPAAGGVRA